MTVEIPIARQVAMIRQRFPNTVLLFRLGDSYEALADDAQVVARELGTRIVERKAPDGSRTATASIPYLNAEQSIGQLVAAGHRVAVCEKTGE